MNLKELYQEIILDHGKNPRNIGKFENFNKDAKGHNPLCGDKVHLFLKLDENKEIKDISFEGEGCAIVVSASDRSEHERMAQVLVDETGVDKAVVLALLEFYMMDMERTRSELAVIKSTSELPSFSATPVGMSKSVRITETLLELFLSIE